MNPEILDRLNKEMESRKESTAIVDLAQEVIKQLNSEMQSALLNHKPSSYLCQLQEYDAVIAKSSMITIQQSERSGTVPTLFSAGGSDVASPPGAADSDEQTNQPAVDMTESSDVALPPGAADGSLSLPGADQKMTDADGNVASPLGVTGTGESVSQQTVQSTSGNVSDLSDVGHSEQEGQTPAHSTRRLSPDDEHQTRQQQRVDDRYCAVGRHSAVHREVMTMLSQYSCMSPAEKAAVESQGVIPEVTLQLLAETLNNDEAWVPVTEAMTQTEPEHVVQYNDILSLTRATMSLHKQRVEIEKRWLRSKHHNLRIQMTTLKEVTKRGDDLMLE